MEKDAQELVASAILTALGAPGGGWDLEGVRSELKSASPAVASELSGFFGGS